MNDDRKIGFCLNNGRLDIDRLFAHYSKPLFYFAAKFVDDEVAKDIVQDVFYKLWENQELKVSSSLNGFLFTMVRNRCLQQIEKQKVRNQYRESVSVSLREEELLFYSQESPDLIQQELQDKLEEALDGLPDKCREVFELSRFHLKKNKEIAENLGISIKTVEKHISKALRYLREEFKDYLPLLLLVEFMFFSSKN